MPFFGTQTKQFPVWLKVQHLFVASQMLKKSNCSLRFDEFKLLNSKISSYTTF